MKSEGLNLYCLLATYLVALVLMLSISLKLIEQKQVRIWAFANLKFITSSKIFYLLFSLVILTECAATLLELRYGVNQLSFSAAIALLIFAASLANKLLSGDGVGCPCFGTLSLRTKFNGFNVSACLLIAVTALLGADRFFGGNFPAAVFCLALSILGVIQFLYGLYLQARQLHGEEVLGLGVASVLTDLGLEVQNKPVAIIFLSNSCEICMSFLKYLENYSLQFSEKISFLLLIEGLPLKENMKFGGSVVLSDEGRLKRQFAIDKTPVMLLFDGLERCRKYTGVDASSLALTKLLVWAP